jgi:hypothetical protein
VTRIEPISGNVLDNDSDVDGDDLNAVLVSGPGNGSLTLEHDGSFSYAPNDDFNGEDSFSYRANDGQVDGNIVAVTAERGAGQRCPSQRSRCLQR